MIYFEAGVTAAQTKEFVRRLRSDHLEPSKTLEVRQYFLRLEVQCAFDGRN
jgi:hypothetical protein